MNTFGRTLEPAALAAGLRCVRELWLRAREPLAPELVDDSGAPDHGELLARLRVRHPDAACIEEPDGSDAVERTAAVLAEGASRVFRGAFEFQGTMVRPDLVTRESGSGVRVTRAERATYPSAHVLRLLAMDVHVMRHAGHDVRDATVIHLDRRSRYPARSEALRETHVGATAETVQAETPGALLRWKNLLYGPCPPASIGSHCGGRHPCPFRRRCAAGVPDDSLMLLHGTHGDFRDEWHARGVRTISGLPADIELDEVQARHRLAVRRRALVVSGDLGSDLVRLRLPAAYLSIGVVAPAIPAWPGCRPLDPAPGAIAVQLEESDGHLRHHDWLYDGHDDPRRRAAEQLLDWTRGRRSVVVYDRESTTRVLRGLRDADPSLAVDLDALEERLVALRPRIERHLYHPRFRGSFELERVVAGVAPEMHRHRLAVTDRAAADLALETLLTPAPDHAAARNAAAFGRFEALALVHIARRLRVLADTQRAGSTPQSGTDAPRRKVSVPRITRD